MPPTAQQRQQDAQEELIAYLAANPQATYRDTFENVSRDAIRQYRRLKQAGRITSNVAIVEGKVVHTLTLVVNDAN